MLVDDFTRLLERRSGLLLDLAANLQDPQVAASLNSLEAIARQVAPVLRLHPDDRYRPAPIEFFLSRVELGSVDRSATDFEPRIVTQVRVGGVSIAALLSQNRFSQKSRSDVLGVKRRSDWRLYIERAQKPSTITPASWKEFCEATRQGLLDGAPCYVHLRRPVDDSAAIDIQYWLFYPFNGLMGTPPFSAEHEGDWEHVTVRVADDGQPLKVYYSAHDGEGSWYRLGQGSPVTLVGGSHPVVYSAYHSHASYPTAGLIVRHGSPIDLPDDRTANGGPEVDISQRLRLIALGDAVVREQEWVHFSGTWGRASSPYGPAFQASWNVEPDVRRT